MWYAEWFSNMVDCCQTPDGKKQFEEWMHLKYGPAALAKLRACYGPKKKINAPSTGNTVMFYTAAYDLGVSGECLIEYTMFASHKMVACPKRTLAAPVRRRGELSSDWLAVAAQWYFQILITHPNPVS
ncbi:hypothetical protein FRB93_005396 [Tulasnella sp. JGI-2019a]|nr:hypothetical protein FRB93_005396 [Tulasnella sp. JGI-2019a]